MKNLFRATAAVCAIGAIAITAGCATQGSNSSETVTIGMVSRTTLTWAPHLAAEGQGFLDDELAAVEADWEVVEFPGGGPMTTALASGDVDFALLPMTAVLALNAKSPGLACVLVPSTGSAVVIIASTDYEHERGDDIAAFDGGNWGYSSEGSSGRVILEMLAQDAGLSWGDQTGIALGAAVANEPALTAGRVDILSSDPVGAQAAIEKGTGYVVVNTNDPQDPQFPYPHAGQCLATSRAMIDEKPELVQAVVDAELAGLNSVKENLESAEDVIALFPELDEGTWDPAEWQLVAPSFVETDGAASDATFSESRELAQRLYEVEISDDVVDSSFDLTFAEKSAG